MIKTATKAFLFFTLLSPGLANAELVTELKIKSDYFPDISYEVGFDINPKNSLIDRVYFNEANLEPSFFTLAELQDHAVTVFKKWGFNFVKMKIVKMDSPTSGTIELSILKYAIFGSRQSIYYDVSLDSSTGQYVIVDRRTKRALKDLIVKTNYRAGMPVGIQDIVGK
jgi:hypothetical protein